jgi:hypothetical protein
MKSQMNVCMLPGDQLTQPQSSLPVVRIYVRLLESCTRAMLQF